MTTSSDEDRDRLMTVTVSTPQGRVLWEHRMDLSSTLSTGEIAEMVTKLLRSRTRLTGPVRSPRRPQTVTPWNRPDDLPDYLRSKK